MPSVYVDILNKLKVLDRRTRVLLANGSGSISSVFGRTGAVVATSGDYNFNQLVGSLTISQVNATGTPSSSTFLRGDGTWSAAGTGTVTSVSGTANRVSSTGGTTPVLDIDAAYVGQTSITTLGTIATGTWNATAIAYAKLSLTGAILNADLAGSIAASKLVGTDIATVGTLTAGTWHSTVIDGQYGGTGVNNTGKTVTLAGNLITSGAFGLTLITTNTTSVTLPTAGTLVNSAVTTLSSLASIGTITTGVWNGTAIAGQYGGTGVANTGFTITLGGNLITSGSFNTTFSASATGTYTLPTATSTLLANNLGISGGSTLVGGTASGNGLTLSSTSNATKGIITFGSASAYDEVNDRIGISSVAPASKLYIKTDAIGTTTNDNSGIILENTTAAANAAQQESPTLVLIGSGWKSNATAASQQIKFRFRVLPVQGTTGASGGLLLSSSLAGAAYALALTINDSGAIVNQTGGTAAIPAYGIGAGRGIFSTNASYTNITANSTDIAAFGTTTGVVVGSGRQIGWSASTSPGVTANDTALFRNAAGVAEINNGTNGTFADLKLRSITSSGAQLVHRTTVADAAYPIVATDYIIEYTSLSTGRTTTLPTAVGAAGQVYIVKDGVGTANTNNITIATTSSQTIDGAATKVINTAWGVFRLYSNNANWLTF